MAAAVEALGEVSGLHAGLGRSDLEELRLTQIVQEALASFGIEGVALDPAEIEASVTPPKTTAQLGAATRTDYAMLCVSLETSS